MSPEPGAYRHAGAVLLGETGILIEGASGSGKSALAEALLMEAGLRGWFGCLVGDDRVAVTVTHGRLVARPHPAIAGLIERRGTGLVRVPHEPACVLGLAVRLAADPPERYPDEPPAWSLYGVALPLLTLPASAGASENGRRVVAALTLPQTVVLRTVPMRAPMI